MEERRYAKIYITISWTKTIKVLVHDFFFHTHCWNYRMIEAYVNESSASPFLQLLALYAAWKSSVVANPMR